MRLLQMLMVITIVFICRNVLKGNFQATEQICVFIPADEKSKYQVISLDLIQVNIEYTKICHYTPKS